MVSRPIWSNIPNGPIGILNIPIQLRSMSSKGRYPFDCQVEGLPLHRAEDLTDFPGEGIESDNHRPGRYLDAA